MSTGFGSGWGDDLGQLAFFTSRTEVESILSKNGVDLRVDDDCDRVVGAAEEDYLVDVMAEATDEVAGYLSHKYTHETLQNSRWVRRVTSYFAASALCRRKGLPDMFCHEIEKYQDLMQKAVEGKFFIADATERTQQGPAVSNVLVDRNYPHSRVRTDRRSSTGDGVPRRDDDHGQLFGIHYIG